MNRVHGHVPAVGSHVVPGMTPRGRRVTAALWVVAMVAILVIQTSHAASHVAQPRVRVDVADVMAVGTEDVPLYKVHLTYAFAGRDSVWLQDVGTVPGNGDLVYVARGNKITFREDSKQAVLASVDVVGADIVMGEPGGLEFPVVTQASWPMVGGELRSGTNVKFMPQKIQNLMLSKLISVAPCIPDYAGCWLTPWTHIPSPTVNPLVEVAVMVTFKPVKPRGSSVTVRYEGRQRYRGDADPEPLTEDTRRQCLEWVAALRSAVLAAVK